MLKDRMASDLKSAMLSGDKTRAENLKMLKSAILYKEVELGARDSGLTDEQIIEVLSKEAKKRLDAAEMFEKAGNTDKAAAEREEHTLISEYLPEQISDEDLAEIISDSITELNVVDIKDMGKVIGMVKSKVGSTADGGRVAQQVKQKLIAS